MRQKTRYGFTYAELIITIMIVATLVAVSVPMLIGPIEDSKGIRTIANLRMLADTARMYINDTGDTSSHLFMTLAQINTFYGTQIQDTNFSYMAGIVAGGATYTFTASRTSGVYRNRTITIDQTGTLSGTWPWLHQ